MGWFEEYLKLPRDQRIIIEHRIQQEVKRYFDGKKVERKKDEPRQEKPAEAGKGDKAD